MTKWPPLTPVLVCLPFFVCVFYSVLRGQRYASSFPTVMTCRLIDIMLSEGECSILLRVALAILRVCEKEILQCGDTEEVMSYLQVSHLFSHTHTHTSARARSEEKRERCEQPRV